MVSIYKIIDTALSTLDMPFFYGMPDFADTEPEKYLTYDDFETAGLFAGNEDLTVEPTITVHIFAPSIDPALNRRVKTALKAAGGIYQGGGKLPSDEVYPYKVHYYMDFNFLMEV